MSVKLTVIGFPSNTCDHVHMSRLEAVRMAVALQLDGHADRCVSFNLSRSDRPTSVRGSIGPNAVKLLAAEMWLAAVGKLDSATARCVHPAGPTPEGPSVRKVNSL